MKKVLSYSVVVFLIAILFIFLRNIPIQSLFYRIVTKDLPMDTVNLPNKNRQILRVIQGKGKSLAPTYNQVVCTEYVINVLEQFQKLSETDKRKIRIITNKNLDSLISEDDNLIKGVAYYFTSTRKGVAIHGLTEAKAGDFIQFWSVNNALTWGHCGIIRGIDTEKGLISLYSSAPSTDGYGKQLYVIPKHYYIARMK